MNTDARARLAYLADCVDLLWPAASDRTERVVLPTAAKPRVLVPRRPWRATAATLARYTAQQGATDQAMAGAVALAFRFGLLRPSAVGATAGTSGESIDDLLAAVLGEPVHTSLALTHPRPNRKPVLQIFDRRGRTIAFAKVGVSPLARDLVAAEAASLRTLAEAYLRNLHVPEVIDHRSWRDTTVLVTTALPMGRPLPNADIAAGTPLGRAMLEVSGINRGANAAAYLTSLRDRAARLSSNAAPWIALIDQAADCAEIQALPTGSWHGDWTEWNCARSRSRGLVVWDWERFASPVPLGFDMLHYLVSDIAAARSGEFARAAHEMVSRSAELLRGWPMRATDSRRVAALYLLDLGIRYRTDDSLPEVEEWVFPIVRSVLSGRDRGATR